MHGSQKKLKKPRAMRPSQIIPKWRGVQEDKRIVDDEFAKVEDLPKDPVEFFEKILRIKPYPYQAKFLRDTSALKVLRWCKRAGKTTVMSGDDIFFAANNPKQHDPCDNAQIPTN